MKFSEMPYARPDLDELKQQLQALTDQLKSAPDYASAHEAFLAQQKLSTHNDTLATLSTHGPRQCSKARSARILQRNTAI